MPDNETLRMLIDRAVASDATAEDGACGFIRVMARRRAAQLDIPVAFELYGLLQHFAEALPWHEMPLEGSLPLTPGLFASDAWVVAMIPIEAGSLSDVAHWLADGLHSGHVKQHAGLLALPFAIETHGGQQHLIPEWFAAFYVNADPSHCVPLLALRSALDDNRIGADWVTVSLVRMEAFGLPSASARSALHEAESQRSSRRDGAA